jgi:hypothetical protein
MKKLIFFLILFVFGFGLSAQTLLTPVNPEVLGHGNATTALPKPMMSFYYNPAGFALENDFVISPINLWLFTDTATLQLLSNPEQAASDIESNLADSNIDQDIADWLNSKSDAELAQIVSDAGYTEADIIAAGGPEPFFDSLTTDEKIAIIGLVLEQPDAPVTADQLGLPSGAFRAGANLGVGLTAGGLGLGTFITLDADLSGNNILVAEGSATAQFTVPVGYAMDFDLGLAKVYVGAQLRPFINFYAPVDNQFIASLVASDGTFIGQLMNTPAQREFGLAIDAGAIVDIWWFNFGVSLFDAFNRTWYDSGTLGDYFNDPNFEPTPGEAFVVDPTLNFGTAFNPQIPVISGIIDPTLYADFNDLGGMISAIQARDTEAIAEMVSVGLDARILNFINARAGYSNGYYALGAGLDLWFLEFDVATTFNAIETENISDFGVSFEARLHF